MWHFSQANSNHIKKAINLFDWESSLNNLGVYEQVSVFNKTIMNIMPGFVPNELVTCDDRDPPWMNLYLKNLMIFIKNLFCLPVIWTNFLCLKIYKTS